MQANNVTPIASTGRLVGFLLIGAGIVAMGLYAQHGGGSAGAASTQFAGHSQAIPIYLTALFMDWALLYYCWAAVHHHGGTLATLSGGRWTTWRELFIDLAIAVPFFALWEGAAYGVHWLLALGPPSSDAAKTVDSLLPQTTLEVLVWIAVSLTAGICEELAFRGFLQRQLHAMSGSLVVAIVGQGLVFGLFHAYQGWRNVVVIAVLGILYGMLAAWRRNVRINIVAHAFTDLWEGWLKFVVFGR